jgi:hypothetical protein
MKLRHILLSGALYSMTATAYDLLTLLIGNTLHETRQNGTQSWFTFDKDHTFHTHDENGKSSSGTWTFSDKGEVCISPQGAPPDAPKPCLLIKGKSVGDGWDREGPNGRKEHFAIEAGRT